jgi:hypothetical protein
MDCWRLLLSPRSTTSDGFSHVFGHLGGMSNSGTSYDATKRIAEIGEILALGLMRLLAPKSRELSANDGESSLDFSADQSSHPENSDRRTTDD